MWTTTQFLVRSIFFIIQQGLILAIACTGASKRGWTTWLVGAVDTTRVMAIVPIVLDAINFVKVILGIHCVTADGLCGWVVLIMLYF